MANPIEGATPLEQLGAEGTVLARLKAAGVFTVDQFLAWLKIRNRNPIPGVGPAQVKELRKLVGNSEDES